MYIKNFLAVANCVFEGNWADGYDAGAISSGGSATCSIDNSRFISNRGLQGGALAGAFASVSSSIFINNEASGDGGSCYGSGVFTNCTFDNSSSLGNGGVSSVVSASTFELCTFSSSTAASGAAIHASAPATIETSIFRDFTDGTDAILVAAGEFGALVFVDAPRFVTNQLAETLGWHCAASLYLHDATKYLCKDCPEGARCDNPGTTLATLPIIPGFWRKGKWFGVKPLVGAISLNLA